MNKKSTSFVSSKRVADGEIATRGIEGNGLTRADESASK